VQTAPLRSHPPFSFARRFTSAPARVGPGAVAGGRWGVLLRGGGRGESGVAESFLRPAGIARFGSRRVDVMSEGDFIERGEKVIIVRVEGNHVIVRKEEEC
jgi:hypothetical protein